MRVNIQLKEFDEIVNDWENNYGQNQSFILERFLKILLFIIFHFEFTNFTFVICFIVVYLSTVMATTV